MDRNISSRSFHSHTTPVVCSPPCYGETQLRIFVPGACSTAHTYDTKGGSVFQSFCFLIGTHQLSNYPGVGIPWKYLVQIFPQPHHTRCMFPPMLWRNSAQIMRSRGVRCCACATAPLLIRKGVAVFSVFFLIGTSQLSNYPGVGIP